MTLLLLAAMFAGAFIQGLSGLGFSLVTVSVATQLFPGSTGVGLTNLFASFGNLWQLGPARVGTINWRVVRTLAPGLAVGVTVGISLLFTIPNEWKPAIVSLSSLASLAALIWWRPRKTRRQLGFLAGAWGGSVNTVAAGGGPPIAIYVRRQGLVHGDFMQTLISLFLILNLLSIPFLGLPPLLDVGMLAVLGVPTIAIGTVLGNRAQRFVNETQARKLSEIIIGLVASTALIRSVWEIMS